MGILSAKTHEKYFPSHLSTGYAQDINQISYTQRNPSFQWGPMNRINLSTLTSDMIWGDILNHQI